MTFLICTSNTGKVKEFKERLPHYQFMTLKDEAIFIDIDETGSSFEENALIKLTTIISKYPYLVDKYDFILAEDSGLCVDALDGAPGIFSARYAGEHGNDVLNNQHLLSELAQSSNRSAHYEVCIAVHYRSKNYLFHGKVNGMISEEPKGDNGFGYDPLFIPDGYSSTFGELNNTVKLKISHRTAAIDLMMNTFHLE